MKSINKAILITTILLILTSGCGSLTKMRYSRGYKANFEFNFKHKTGKAEELKACKAEKKQRTEFSNNNKSKLDVEISTIKNPVTSEENFNSTHSKQIRKSKFPNRPNTKQPIITKTNVATTDDRLMEPHVKIAGFLFFIGLALGVFIEYFFILCIIGFIFAIIGLKKVKAYNGLMRGRGLALFIIIFTIISLILGGVFLIYFIFVILPLLLI